MCRFMPPALPIALLLGALALPSALPAQSPQETGTHVVRESETLEGIAAYYLGSAGRWREIWKLNQADVADPDLIHPGYKLKVPVPAKLPEQAAVVAMLARRVEGQRRPLPLEPARQYDFMKPLDVLQTYEAASAEIRFGDDTSLFMTEQSRVVLGATAAVPAGRQQIEIVDGQADLESRPPAGAALDIEIVMGDAVVTPRPGAAGEPVKARSRRPQGRGALLMIYQGEGDVAAAGATVKVPRGMGTTVAEGAAPGPPEKLLDAPRVVRPEAGSRLDVPNPTFAWEPVAGAVGYTLEVCRDPKCGALELRATDLKATTWQGAALPVAGFYWRVTARSPSGLDGYPSAPTEFAVVTAVARPADRTAPRAGVRFLGPQVGVGDRLVVGVGAEIRGETADEETGVASWTRLLDGEEVSADGWRAPWAPGPHLASIHAVDRAGNQMTMAPAPFVYDPEPPVISWGREDGPPLGEASGETAPEVAPLDEKEELGFWARTAGRDRSPLVWTASELKWLPMGYGVWKISSDKPFILVRARKKRPVSFPGLGERVTRDRGLWIHAVDAGCGVEHMTYQVLVGPNGQEVLAVEAVDALDNKSRVVWPLVRD